MILQQVLPDFVLKLLGNKVADCAMMDMDCHTDSLTLMYNVQFKGLI